MLRCLTNGEMRACDGYTIRTLGVPSLTLMERAGEAIYEAAAGALRALGARDVLAVCGGGNNGGDGFVAARRLAEAGFDAEVLCLADRFSADCAAEKDRFGGRILREIPQRRCSVVIDCVFGTGLSRDVGGREAALIDYVNGSGAYVIAADIPSGLNGDSGRVMGRCVRADETVAVGEFKLGHFLGDGPDMCGKAVRADIGIDVSQAGGCALIPEGRDIAALFPPRRRNTHKGTYGKASVIAGSRLYTGAALLSASAALRGGAGYTELCVPEGLFGVYAGRLPEAILTCLKGEDSFVFCEADMEKVCKSQSIAFGMGVGVSQEIYKMILWLLKNYEGTLILDADALNTLARYGVQALGGERRCEVILTPHAREFSRLSGLPVSQVLADGLACARAFSEKYSVTVLLKNAVSAVCGGGQTYLNVRGSACQAKGGSGDVLSGLIASVAAQGRPAAQSALAGAYLCGAAAELCEAELGAYSVTAGDVIGKIPQAIRALGNA